MESNVILVHISNGHNKLLPFCLGFMVSSYCSLLLLVTINPTRLIRSPLKEGTELSNQRLMAEPKETVQVGRTWGRSGSHCQCICGCWELHRMTYQKGGCYYEDMGRSQETEDMIELELERTRNNKYKSISIPSSLPFLLLCPTYWSFYGCSPIWQNSPSMRMSFTRQSPNHQGDFSAYFLISSVGCSYPSGHYSSLPACSA